MIYVADVENTALTTYKDPPNTYRHFVDDGIGDFRDKSHADGFLSYLNSLTDDLQYTIEYPQAIQQTTKGRHSILDSILSLPPYHHQKDQEIPSIPRRQSHKFIRDYPSGPTHQNEDHTSSSPHSQRHL